MTHDPDTKDNDNNNYDVTMPYQCTYQGFFSAIGVKYRVFDNWS